MSAAPQRPSMSARQPTGRTASRTHSRNNSLTGSDNINKAPSSNGHQRRLSGTVPRRASITQTTTTNPALINTYAYVGMMGKRTYYQDDRSYSFELITPTGKVQQDDSDLAAASHSHREGDLLFQNSWDRKLYKGSNMTPAFPYTFAGFYHSMDSFQNEGAGGNAYFTDFKGEQTIGAMYSNDPPRQGGCFKPGEISKLRKGDVVWRHERSDIYYAAKSFFQ